MKFRNKPILCKIEIYDLYLYEKSSFWQMKNLNNAIFFLFF